MELSSYFTSGNNMVVIYPVTEEGTYIYATSLPDTLPVSTYTVFKQ
ncbi:MAG: hypothetical protein K6B75_04475 [Lachnospiraceae bacterium]|nr:hypothetical protein [Lachnospiraceae bacterium]